MPHGGHAPARLVMLARQLARDVGAYGPLPTQEGGQQHFFNLLIVATLERIEAGESTGQQERMHWVSTPHLTGETYDPAQHRLQERIVLP